MPNLNTTKKLKLKFKKKKKLIELFSSRKKKIPTTGLNRFLLLKAMQGTLRECSKKRQSALVRAAPTSLSSKFRGTSQRAEVFHPPKRWLRVLLS